MGKEEALRKVDADDRHLVRIAAEVLTEEANEIGVTYSGFCQASLPHKKLAADEPWVRRNEQITLMVEPGRLLRPGALQPELLEVPYGSRARLILLYLQTRALRSGCREVELGRSMRVWLQRMGISHGGKFYNEVRDQAARLSTCKLTFYYSAAKGRTGFTNERIVDSGMMMLDDEAGDGRQESLFVEGVMLSESFYSALKRHSVSIWEPALQYIQNNSMARDLYVWLAYRLHIYENRPWCIRVLSTDSSGPASRLKGTSGRHAPRTYASHWPRIPMPGSTSKKAGSSCTRPVPRWPSWPDDKP